MEGSSVSIHPYAIISPDAEIGPDVSIGPFCVVEDGVKIGEGCQLASNVIVKRGTVLGPKNRVAESVVLGGLPQHAKAEGPFGGLVLGTGNVIREHTTFHVALTAGKNTTIGDNNLFMVGSHVAHDVTIGSQVILVNQVLIGGHAVVEDRAYLGGAAGVHQFCRVGRNAMIGAHARIVQDVPPYMMVDGDTAKIVGLNLVGLRRAGYTSDEIGQLKYAYRVIYRSGLSWDEVLEQLGRECPSGPAALLHPFLSAGTRGFIQERRTSARTTLRIAPTDAAATSEDASRKVG